MRAPEAGLPIDKDMAFVIVVNQVLVAEFGARPVLVRFVLDSQRTNGVDGHFEAEYEMRSGQVLSLHMKRSGRSMAVRVALGRAQFSYSVEIDRYITDDLVPTDIAGFRELVSDWFGH